MIVINTVFVLFSGIGGFVLLAVTCSKCGSVFGEDELIIDEAKAPTCTETGLTDGARCPVCGKVIKTQEVVPAPAHQYEVLPAVEATYYSDGSTVGVRCKLCGEWLVEPQVVPKKKIDFTFGDSNGDGEISIRDVTAIQRFLAQLNTLSEKQLGAADVNFDGVVDIKDITLLQMYFAEFDVVLGKQS